MDRENLEQLTHRISCGQAIQSGLDILRAFGIAPQKGRGARLYSKPAQPVALCHQWAYRRACLACGPHDSGEIDVTGEVLLARISEDRRKAMAAHRLKRVAMPGGFMAIVNEDACPTMLHEMFGDASHGLLARGRSFDDLAVAIEGKSACSDDHLALDSV